MWRCGGVGKLCEDGIDRLLLPGRSRQNVLLNVKNDCLADEPVADVVCPVAKRRAANDQPRAI